jgi:hypothetical protein
LNVHVLNSFCGYTSLYISYDEITEAKKSLPKEGFTYYSFYGEFL